ncbi:MAG TPA: hypothetical protein VGD74_09755 [Vulgatibacter sp.]
MNVTDYNLTPDEADLIGAAATLPLASRLELLRLYEEKHGAGSMRHLLAHTIGAANSVIANARESVEMALITELHMHPHTAEKVNLPTLFGAMRGVRLAAGIDTRSLCAGCAYRCGAVANQCEPTIADAELQAEDNEPFFCHAEFDDKGNAINLCAGHAQAVRARGCTPTRKEARG